MFNFLQITTIIQVENPQLKLYEGFSALNQIQVVKGDFIFIRFSREGISRNGSFNFAEQFEEGNLILPFDLTSCLEIGDNLQHFIQNSTEMDHGRLVDE